MWLDQPQKGEDVSQFQLAIFYTPTGEVVRLISYSSRITARNNGRLAMKWLNPDRFHFVVLEGKQALPSDFIGVPSQPFTSTASYSFPETK